MMIDIRKGRKEDIQMVYSLVKELALFERAPDAVVTTEKEYLDLYEESLFDFFIAETEGQIVGMALFYFTFSTWKGKMLYLEDFVVRQNFRRQGIGKSLFEAVIGEAKRTDCALMKWEVLDWNEKAITFYEKYESDFDKDWWNGKIYFK